MVLYFYNRIYLIGGYNMSDINFDQLMKMISQMDQSELQSKINEASRILNSKDSTEFLQQLNNNFKNNK